MYILFLSRWDYAFNVPLQTQLCILLSLPPPPLALTATHPSSVGSSPQLVIAGLVMKDIQRVIRPFLHVIPPCFNLNLSQVISGICDQVTFSCRSSARWQLFKRDHRHFQFLFRGWTHQEFRLHEWGKCQKCFLGYLWWVSSVPAHRRYFLAIHSLFTALRSQVSWEMPDKAHPYQEWCWPAALPSLAPLCTYGFTPINIPLPHMSLSKSLSYRYSSLTAVQTDNEIDCGE